MAKDYGCCGGDGAHLPGCDDEHASRGSWRLRSQVPGNRQGWFLDSLAKGEKPRGGRGYVTNDNIEAMQKRGWIKMKRDGSWEITEAGQAAHRIWAREKPSLPPDAPPPKRGKDPCPRCGGRKTIPGPRRSWINCPRCNGTGNR